ncbi:MAG: peptide deformylase [Planctomycetales bacterium 12-60-4]|nr:MAG: peptide deformylase [Planctomycetales bacterium 12-60-4]
MEIVQYPHPALRWKSRPVQEINADLRRIVAEMFELMYAHNGIGLAANQVDLPYRLFVLNLTGDKDAKDEELVFLNPEILRRKGTVEGEEGCLSFPGLYADVKRAAEIVVEAFDLSGSVFEYSLTELGSRAVQHENDHLDGVLFIDRMTESVRRNCDPMVDDFEAQFRRLQAEGKYPSDDVLKQSLKDREPVVPAK